MSSVGSDCPVILITGCSSGFGKSLAQEALAMGLRVIATARKISAIEDLQAKGARVFSLDVNDSVEELRNFAEKAVDAFGQLDILCNNAGWLLGGAIEENTPEEIRSQFNTNFFSVINVTNAFLPHFRARKTGTIVNMSSSGAYFPPSGAGIYCTSKAALDCLTETWAGELRPFNIRAMSVNLGSFRSLASSNAKPPMNTIEGYANAHSWFKNFQERGGQNASGDPDKAAKKLLELITLKTDKALPIRFALGEDAVRVVREKLRQRIAELDEYQSFGMGTNVDEIE